MTRNQVTIAGLTAVAALVAGAGTANAQSTNRSTAASVEKCYGVALAGKTIAPLDRVRPAPERRSVIIRATPGRTSRPAPALRSRRRAATAR